MTLHDFESDGFKLVKEFRGPVDSRGVDGCMILRKRKYHKGKKNGVEHYLYIAAHYAKQNIYGTPIRYAP